MYCKHCGKELPLPDSDICINCGKIVEKPRETQISSEPIKKPSKAWYLVPIFFGIIGGLAMYLVLKDEDKKMAKKGLVLGIILGAAGITAVVSVYGVLLGLAFSHLNQPHQTTYPSTTPQKPIYFPGVVKFYNVAGGGGEIDNRIFKQLPSALSATGWSADFDYRFTASSMQRSWIFVLSATSDDPAKQDFAHIIMVEHGFNADQLMIDRSWTGPNSTSSTGISISPDTQYYVRLQRAPTQLELSVFSDPSRTINVAGSPVTLNILPSDYNNNLNFIQHDGCTPCGAGRTLTAEIDNTKIYDVVDDVKHILFQDNYSSSVGWAQIGSSIAINGSFVQRAQPYSHIGEGTWMVP